MKKYIVDSNVFLRFLLRDNKKYYQAAKRHFQQARRKKIELILIPQVILEIDYVLRGVYSLSRKESADVLAKLVKSPDLKVKNRDLLIEVIEEYKKMNVDLLDLYIYEKAKVEKAEVFSFDQDFARIKKAKK